MSVSTRNIYTATVAASALLVLGGTAIAGNMGSSGPSGPSVHGPSVSIPGVNVGTPGVNVGGNTGGNTGCCGNGGMMGKSGVSVVAPNVNVPGATVLGPNVNVGGTNTLTNTTNFTSTFVNNVQTGRNDSFAVSGGSFYSPMGVAPSEMIVDGGTESYTDTITEQVPVTEETCADQISTQMTVRPVRAVCIDDKGSPHPASQVDAGQRVSQSFNGEIFRCMAGTTMQVTMGSLNGNSASFDNAETFTCRKGEALVHRSNGGVTCAPQAPQRDCNERSLLRRHGPGLKLVTATQAVKTCVPQTRTRYETVSKQVQRQRQLPSTSIVFDGGVGNGIY